MRTLAASYSAKAASSNSRPAATVMTMASRERPWMAPSEKEAAQVSAMKAARLRKSSPLRANMSSRCADSDGLATSMTTGLIPAARAIVS